MHTPAIVLFILLIVCAGISMIVIVYEVYKSIKRLITKCKSTNQV